MEARAAALRRAEAAHGEHEARTGEADPNWPDWYAEYMVREQAGEELPEGEGELARLLPAPSHLLGLLRDVLELVRVQPVDELEQRRPAGGRRRVRQPLADCSREVVLLADPGAVGEGVAATLALEQAALHQPVHHGLDGVVRRAPSGRLLLTDIVHARLPQPPDGGHDLRLEVPANVQFGASTGRHPARV